MKKLIGGTMIVMAMTFAAAMPLMADTAWVGGYTWTYRVIGDTAEISKSGNDAAISPLPTGDLTIPDTLGGKTVTSIGAAAFYGCSSLTSVTIPDSVTSIRTWAFYGCSSLTSVTIPGGVTSIVSTVTQGTGLSAFDGCIGLRDVTVPQCVLDRQIRYVFPYIYSSLTNVSYSSVITNIGKSAFYGCSGLTSVTIPDSVTGIGFAAFYSCTNLTSVTIPDSVTSIGENAFDNCNASLYDTNSISGVNLVDGWAIGNAGYLSGSLDLTGARGVGERAFCNCSGLTNVVIGSGVTCIGESAFSGCSGLTSVTIPNSVTSLSTTAFDGCGKLWTAWYRTLANSSASDGISHSVVTTVVQQVVTTIVQQVESPYTLTDHAADRAIASLTVDADCAIDEFVLKNGEVYDTMLRIVNAADHEVRLTLPAGYVYETFKGVKPLAMPANSRNILTITRTKADTFLVSREELETVQ